ncbi:hypothetical protein CSW98_15295 [Vibrio sp. HA2012]|uniref:YrbL family protein n=1 Tax=Vibrio sp. HA2012 TaxID=1971595 RepID=UPI000C2B81C0|nr:YrbL family protein [Vibrio sp. HA2012]PJC85204.1 hypothetical protein CSW98_15295 [Vibrio sp. HA2012]
MHIRLEDKFHLASGGARDVYFHPENERLCIKIQRVNGTQNLNEEFFYKKQREGINILPKYIGNIKTNLGVGLVVELIRDFDGEVSKPLSYYINNNIITLDAAKSYIQEIANEVIDKKILLHDGGLQNILLKKTGKDLFQPMLVDGFGAKNNSLKYMLRTMLPILSVKKSKKQIKIMMNDKCFRDV